MDTMVEQEELNRKNESEEVKEESEKSEDTGEEKEDKPGFFSRAWSKVKSGAESVIGFGRKSVSWFKGEDDVDSMSDDEFLDHLYSQNTDEDPDYSKRYQELLKELSSMPSLMAFAEKADAKDVKEATDEAEKKEDGAQPAEAEAQKKEEGAKPAKGEKSAESKKGAEPAKAAKSEKAKKSTEPAKAAESEKSKESAAPAKESKKAEKSAEPAKAAESEKAKESAAPAKAAEGKKAEESAEPAKAAEGKKAEESAEPAKAAESEEAKESAEEAKSEDKTEAEADSKEEEEKDDTLKPLKDQAKELGIDDKKAYKKVEGVADKLVKTKDDVSAAGKASADIYKSKKRAERLGKMIAETEPGSEEARKLQYMKDDAEKKASTSGFDVATGVVNTVTKLVSSFAGSKTSKIFSKIAGLVNKGLAFGKEKIAQKMDKKAVKNGLKGLIGGSDAYKKLKQKYRIKAPDLRRAIRTAAKASSGKELANSDKDKLLEEEES